MRVEPVRAAGPLVADFARILAGPSCTMAGSSAFCTATARVIAHPGPRHAADYFFLLTVSS